MGRLENTGCSALLSLLLCLLPMLNALAQSDVPTRTLRYVGSSTVGNFIQDVQQHYPDAEFLLNTEAESAGGEQAISEGRCDLAGVARQPAAELLATAPWVVARGNHELCSRAGLGWFGRRSAN